MRLLTHPQLRKFIIFPVVINCLILGCLMVILAASYQNISAWELTLPEWLKWLEFLEKTINMVAWGLIFVTVLVIYSYSFNIITNFLAAPFYGLLAQKAEEVITGEKLADEPIHKLVPRTLSREIGKLVYFVFRGLIIFLVMVFLAFIFVLSFLAPLLGLLWSAWCMTIQYVDYSADNHQTPFDLLRIKLRKRTFSTIGFGGSVMLCTMIPFVNIFIIPAAVIGGTIMWVEELKCLSNNQSPSTDQGKAVPTEQTLAPQDLKTSSKSPELEVLEH